MHSLCFSILSWHCQWYYLIYLGYINEFSIIKSNISLLKTQLDPADIRLAKWDGKPVSPLNQNLQKELVVVGFSYELKKSETAIKEYILKQNLLKNSYHLAFFFSKVHDEKIKEFMVSFLDKKTLSVFPAI